MSTIRYQVAVLKSRFITHRMDTDGFKLDFQNASDKDILDTTPVSQDTINGLSNVIMKIIVPKQRSELRLQIAYLIGLRHRQAEAWERLIADYEARTNNTNQWVAQNER